MRSRFGYEHPRQSSRRIIATLPSVNRVVSLLHRRVWRGAEAGR
jgi:hypothetical protein